MLMFKEAFMQHYYTNDPDLAHDERTFDFELGGHRLRFTTDNGVFQSIPWISAVAY